MSVLKEFVPALLGANSNGKSCDSTGKGYESSLEQHKATAPQRGGSIPTIESLDTSSPDNLVQIRDLETGVYMLYGYFSPFRNSDVTMTFDNSIVCISRKTAGTHLMCLTALNCKVNFLEILVDESAPGGHTYTRTDINLLDLHALIGRVEALEAARNN